MQSHRSRPARRAAIALLAAGVLAATAACSGSSSGLGVAQIHRRREPGAPTSRQFDRSESSSSSSSPVRPSSTTAAPQPVAQVTRVPGVRRGRHLADRAGHDLVAKGTIADTLGHQPGGRGRQRHASADKTSWTLAEPLGYGRTYTVDRYRDRHRRQVRPDRRQLHDRDARRRDHHLDLPR